MEEYGWGFWRNWQTCRSQTPVPRGMRVRLASAAVLNLKVSLRRNKPRCAVSACGALSLGAHHVLRFTKSRDATLLPSPEMRGREWAVALLGKALQRTSAVRRRLGRSP